MEGLCGGSVPCKKVIVVKLTVKSIGMCYVHQGGKYLHPELPHNSLALGLLPFHQIWHPQILQILYFYTGEDA